jgi:hypothetical protein
MDKAARAREARARRAAAKCGDGFRLTKGRGRGYMIVHPETSSVVLTGRSGDGWSMTIEEVEEFAGKAGCPKRVRHHGHS